MGVLQRFTFKYNQGDLDGNSRELQRLDTVHRTAIMSLLRGKNPAGQAQFKDPIGIASYNGFGADGWYYTGGVSGRVWKPREVIDDFTDLVTDPERWEGIVNNFNEGGIDFSADGPFGKRLFCEYSGPGVEDYDRKGKMVRTTGSSDKAVLSGRVNVPVETGGVNVDNCILLAIQQQGSDNDFVFVGTVNTTTYPLSVIHGHCIAGVYSVTSSVVLPPGTEEVDIAIELDELGGTYRGFYTITTMVSDDYTTAGWIPVGVGVALGAGWPANAVPRIHARYPASYNVGERRSLSDVRVEVDGGDWEGQARATWWLETQDVTNVWTGVQAECPDELFVAWEREASGNCSLALIDVDDPENPTLWRRWPYLAHFKTDNFENVEKYWSPGWIDADEGHIVLTRNTKGNLEGATSYDERAEVWLISLRWDKVIVFDIETVGAFITYHDEVTGRILREGSVWGGRRWNSSLTYSVSSYNDRFQVPQSAPNFVGTLVNTQLEDAAPGLTYGVSVRRTEDDLIYLAYGVQKIPDSYPGHGPYFAGLILLDEVDPNNVQYSRWLFQKDDTSYVLWDYSDEAWVVVGLAYQRGIWWLQGGEDGNLGEIEGVLSRRDFGGVVPDNVSTSPYHEDDYWRGPDLFIGMGVNLNVMDNDPASDELILVASGWFAGSHLTSLFYDASSPSTSIYRTYGTVSSVEQISHQMNRVLPYNEFPRWFAAYQDHDDAELKRSRITCGSGVGADSYLPVSEGMWLAYGKFNGLVDDVKSQVVLRGAAIDRDEFVLETFGRIILPFAAGYSADTLQHMATGQSFRFVFGVRGEKRFSAIIMMSLSGGGSVSSGQMNLVGAIAHLTGSGTVSAVNAISAPSTMFVSGGVLHFRIRRTGTLMELLFWNTDSHSWKVLVGMEVPQLPLVPFLGTVVSDTDGLACGAGVELSRFQIAPVDDPRGGHFNRPVDFATIPSKIGSVAGAAVFREAIPTEGGIIEADGWFFPGLMPRP